MEEYTIENYKEVEEELEKLGLPNICIIKKLDLKSGELLVKRISFSYWIKSAVVTMFLSKQKNGLYTISLNKNVICEDVEIQKVLKTLDSYSFSVILDMFGKVISFSYKKKGNNKNAKKKKRKYTKKQ